MFDCEQGDDYRRCKGSVEVIPDDRVIRVLHVARSLLLQVQQLF